MDSVALRSTESHLAGEWTATVDGVRADETCDRIQRLIESRLVLVGVSQDGWSSVFQDPADGRYWELTYPLSQMHGGGPPALDWLSSGEVLARYPLVTLRDAD